LGWPCFARPPESPAPCCCTVATVYPQGNCDWSKPETGLNYLTRFGTVSISFLIAQFLLRVTGRARTPPEELVNTAFGVRLLQSVPLGVEPTSLSRPFPGHPGLSLEF
jgi:hypothetical protein